MTNKIKLIAVFLGLIGAAFFIWNRWENLEKIVKKSDGISSSEKSLTRARQLKATDPQMAGLIEPGADLYWIEDFYASHPFQPGDFVYFRYQTDQIPVVRVVRGVPGDRFEVVKDEAGKGWKIRINDVFIKVGNDDLVFGSPDFVPPLGLAEKSHRNQIGPGELLLMTNSRSGRFDSTLMGLIPTSDIVGKIILSEDAVTKE